MLKLCELKKTEPAKQECIDMATQWTTGELKKLQDTLNEALDFCKDFIDKHKEFDTAAEEKQKEIKKNFQKMGMDLAESLKAKLLKKSIGLRNLLRDDSRAVATVFREGLGAQSPVPSYSGGASGAVEVDGDLLRLTIATGSIAVTDFSGTQTASLTGTLTLRDRGAVNSVRVVETSDLRATVGSLTFLGFVSTGTNTALLSATEKGFGTLDGTLLKVVVPATIENDTLTQSFVTLRVPLTGQIDTAAGTFMLSSSDSSLDLFPVSPAGFLMTSFDITGTAQGGSILATTVPGNIRTRILTKSGESADSVAQKIETQLNSDLSKIGAAGVVANTGLVFFVGLSADEVFIETRDPGLQVELLP